VELSWSTFLLELINFLVLVWILKRFLYKPVLDIINKRRADIERELADAQDMNEQAKALRTQYQQRLSDWEQEQRQKRDNMEQEIDRLRTQKLTELDGELKNARQKNSVIEERRTRELAVKAEELALTQAASFAGNLLREAAGPDLEARLVELTLKQAAAMSDERIASLRAMWTQPPDEITIASAFPLNKQQQQSLAQVLKDLTGLQVPVQFRQQSELMAGVLITVGHWVLHLNLRDELKSFADFNHGA